MIVSRRCNRQSRISGPIESRMGNPKQLGSEEDVRSQRWQCVVVDPSFAVWSPQRGATEGSSHHHHRPG